MSNILNHNRTEFYFRINTKEYWDFHLHRGRMVVPYTYGFQDKCLISYIDINDNACVEDDFIISKDKYVWEDAVNNGITLENVGFTCVDNGLISYNKYHISNDDFLELFQHSKYTFQKDDLRLKLNKVNGNNQIFNYDNDIVTQDNITISKLNGGFYQGVFRGNDKCDLNLLPTIFPNGITLEFVLKREDFEEDGKVRLNTRYPQNKGLFFYMGTRAENKWWIYYDTEEKFPSTNSYFIDGYTKENIIRYETLDSEKPYFTLNSELNYLTDEVPAYTNTYTLSNNRDILYKYNGIINDGYYLYGLDRETEKENGEKQKGYIKEDEIETSSGFLLVQPNYHVYNTENKFLLFHRGKDGLNVHTYKEGDTLMVVDIDFKLEENPFLLFNRTKNGYNVHNAPELYEKSSKKYNVINDIVENAFGFIIKDDNSIGYKYLVRDCDSENKYKIEEEYSNPDTVPYKEWVVIDVRIEPNVRYPLQHMKENNKMRMLFYVNGNLVLRSKELPLFNFRKLNDMDEKQELVPFNISLGGGTQGLADVIYYNFMEEPKYSLPLEENFGGTFIGYFKSFKFYNCSLNYNEINEGNNIFEGTKFK